MDASPPSRAAEPAESLRRQFAAGQPAAIDALVVAFYGDVVRFAAAIAADAEAGLDAAQETFLRVFELHATYDPGRAFRPWLFGIARRCALEVSRKGRRQAARVVAIDGLEADSQLLKDEAPSAAERHLRQQLMARAVDGMAQLDEASRAIVHLHLFEELTFREVAEALDRPPSAVASAYYRAIARLRESLEPPASKESSHGS